jgi:HlyD family secretion protein
MRKRRWRRGILWVGGLVALVAAGGVLAWAWPVLTEKKRPSWADLPRVEVRRQDLHITLTAGGTVDSSQKTLIECELENIAFGSEGRSIATSGYSTILDLIPDGTYVKEGDVLCRLDSSEYEEMVRQQEIKLETARADFQKAKLDLEVAEYALNEYREGLRQQTEQSQAGQIRLAEADLKRQEDRVDWSAKMMDLGYVSKAKHESELISKLRLALNLRKLRATRDAYRRYSDPVQMRTLENRIESAQATHTYQTSRLEKTEDRLEHYKAQVEACTIRAPHDGFLIYANEPDGDPKVELGARVKQKQDLFYLPDLSQMEVQTQIHESVVERVRAGMTARVVVEALPERSMEAHVVAVSALPVTKNSWKNPDVRNYVGRIKLDTIPKGLRPGMSAAVEISTGDKPYALVVPSEAVTIEEGQDVCYVAGPLGLERREVSIGEASHELLEVTEGLAEGEEVILEPDQIEPAELAEAASAPDDEAGQPAPIPTD